MEACTCSENAFDSAVAAITAAAVEAATAQMREAMTAATAVGDERLVTLETRVADLEGALAQVIAREVKVSDL